MKKLLAILMAGAMIVSLASCGGQGDTKDNESATKATTEAKSEPVLTNYSLSVTQYSERFEYSMDFSNMTVKDNKIKVEFENVTMGEDLTIYNGTVSDMKKGSMAADQLPIEINNIEDDMHQQTFEKDVPSDFSFTFDISEAKYLKKNPSGFYVFLNACRDGDYSDKVELDLQFMDLKWE